MNEYEFIIVPAEMWDEVLDLGIDVGEPRIGPDGRYLTNKNGNVPFTQEELDVLEILGAEVVDAKAIEAWLETNGWNTMENEL